MNNQDNIGVTFVNSLATRGIFNGIINLSFATFNFTPNNGQVEADPVISLRMRMDKVCARELRDALNELINSIEQAELEAAPKETSGGLVPSRGESTH